MRRRDITFWTFWRGTRPPLNLFALVHDPEHLEHKAIRMQQEDAQRRLIVRQISKTKN